MPRCASHAQSWWPRGAGRVRCRFSSIDSILRNALWRVTFCQAMHGVVAGAHGAPAAFPFVAHHVSLCSVRHGLPWKRSPQGGTS